MPFQSEKQRKYLWANEPEIARDWTNRYGARGGGIMRIPLANGLRPDPFYNQKDFRGNQLSDTGVQMMYKTPRTIADQNRVLGQTFTEKQPHWYNKMFNKAGQGIKKGWQGAKDFKTSIGEGIAGILDNTMIGKIAAMNNALNPRAANYNPDLQGQIDFLEKNNMYGNDWDQSGLNKITGGVLAGKNLQSMFGSNDYGMMLQKRIDYFRNKKSRTKLQNSKMHKAIEEKKLADKAGAQRASTLRQQVRQQSEANRQANTGGWQSGMAKDKGFMTDTAEMGSFNRGGIAGLWPR